MPEQNSAKHPQDIYAVNI